MPFIQQNTKQTKKKIIKAKHFRKKYNQYTKSKKNDLALNKENKNTE